MVNDELILYIKKQIEKENSENFIKNKLLDVGWKEEDIDEGLIKAKEQIEKGKNEIKIDPYRELTENQEELLLNKKDNLEKSFQESTNNNNSPVWTPVKVKVLEESPQKPSPVIMTAESFKEKKPDIDVNQAILNVDNIQNKSQLPIRSNVFDNLAKMKSSQESSTNKTEKKHRSFWMIILLITLIILAGLAFVVMKGYIEIPFVKKDPRVLLLNNEEKLSSLSYYKTESSIKITSPTFANISTSLATGDSLSTIDQDYVSITSNGLVNQSENNFNTENISTITSSILKNPIVLNIKDDDSGLYITMPDLSELMGNNAPSQDVVFIANSDSEKITSLSPDSLKIYFNDLDLFKIFKGGLSSYFTDNSLISYREFLNSIEITEKGKEVVKGVETYHYDITNNEDANNSIVSEFINHFISAEDSNLKETLSSMKINSFEIWIGKDDNNIYQYKISISLPLSNILNIKDSSLGNSEVVLDWTNTYYDFDVTNNISIPEDYKDIDTYIKESDDIKLKNQISNLSENFNLIKNSEGNYGISNNGNCVNSTSGSLFSPNGHLKNSVLIVGDISELMNNILLTTNNSGYCFSNSSSYAVSFPLESEVGTYFCLDSTGKSEEILFELKGAKCSE